MDRCSIGQWDKIKVVGKGGSSTVFKARLRSTGQIVAVKQIETDGLSRDQVSGIQGEIDTIRTLDHPNVVTYLGTQQVSNKIFIFLEFAGRGSLRQFYQKKGKLQEPQVAYCTKQILLGLKYLHGNGIAHRDIKCANCLLAQGNTIKLADFGASKKFDSISIVSGLKGTPHWMAPEVIRGTQMTNGWMKADVWSLGCTVVELVTGRVPFADYENPMTAMYHIANGKAPPIKDHDDASPEMIDFLSICCAPEPADRPSVDVLLDHPFITRSAMFRKDSSRYPDSQQGVHPMCSNEEAAQTVDSDGLISAREKPFTECNTFEDLLGIDHNKEDYDDDDFEEYLPTVAEENVTNASITIVAGNPYATKNAAATAKGYINGWEGINVSPRGGPDAGSNDVRTIENLGGASGRERYAEVDFDLNADVEEYCKNSDTIDSYETVKTHNRGLHNIKTTNFATVLGPTSSVTPLPPSHNASRGSNLSARGSSSGSDTGMRKSNSSLGLPHTPNKMIMLPSPVMQKVASNPTIVRREGAQMHAREDSHGANSLHSPPGASGGEEDSVHSVEDEVNSDTGLLQEESQSFEGVKSARIAEVVDAYDDNFEHYESPKASPGSSPPKHTLAQEIVRVTTSPTKAPTTVVIDPMVSGRRKSVIEILDDAKIDPSKDVTITVERGSGDVVGVGGGFITNSLAAAPYSSGMDCAPIRRDNTSVGLTNSVKTTIQRQSQVATSKRDSPANHNHNDRLGSRQSSAQRQNTAQSIATPTTHSSLSTPCAHADFLAPSPSGLSSKAASGDNVAAAKGWAENGANGSFEETAKHSKGNESSSPVSVKQKKQNAKKLMKQESEKVLQIEKAKRRKGTSKDVSKIDTVNTDKDQEKIGTSGFSRQERANRNHSSIESGVIDRVGKQISAAVQVERARDQKVRNNSESLGFDMINTNTISSTRQLRRAKAQMKPLQKIVKAQKGSSTGSKAPGTGLGQVERSIGQSSSHLLSSTMGAMDGSNASGINAGSNARIPNSSMIAVASRSKSAPVNELQGSPNMYKNRPKKLSSLNTGGARGMGRSPNDRQKGRESKGPAPLETNVKNVFHEPNSMSKLATLEPRDLFSNGRSIKSAPAISRSLNLPPILETQTPNRKFLKGYQGFQHSVKVDPGVGSGRNLDTKASKLGGGVNTLEIVEERKVLKMKNSKSSGSFGTNTSRQQNGVKQM